MRRPVFLAVGLLLAVGAGSTELGADEPYVYGKVVRHDRGREVPQSGLKVVLAQGATEGTPAHTSPYGTYGIYSLPGPPGEYELRVYSREGLRKAVRVLVGGTGNEVNLVLP
jgi:hypothetical protein